MVKYFLDTYALIEMIKGNKNYSFYSKAELFTSIFNLYELYYNLLREEGEEIARNYFSKFKSYKITP